jgi:geranylgeranyl diphosphate synthase type I
MRDELMAGQYLDVLEGALATTSIDRSLKVARYKSGKYSIERPLHFGAALSGKKELMSAYSSFGLPLGEAFQLRDDLLGVFGDPEVTGKPAGDDLREGKRTVLIALTMQAVGKQERELLTDSLGDEGLDKTQILELQEIISSSGAVAQVEKLITELRDRAISALRDSQVETSILSVLEEMATIATQRSL